MDIVSLVSLASNVPTGISSNCVSFGGCGGSKTLFTCCPDALGRGFYTWLVFKEVNYPSLLLYHVTIITESYCHMDGVA